MKELLKQFLDGRGLFYSRIAISDNIEMEQGTGFIFCKNSILGHVGVQVYNGTEVGLKDKKTVEVVRLADDVFDEDSMASFDGKPLTLYHPNVLVDSKNIKQYAVGHVKNVRRDGDNLVGDLVIQDEEAVKAVIDGKLKDLSLGYQAKLVPMADGRLKQEQIVINHLALVEEGRAINARIVDENTVMIGEKDGKVDDNESQSQNLNDTIHKNERTVITKHTSEYDDETGHETNHTETVEHSEHTHYEKLKSEYLDHKQKMLDKQKQNQEGEKKVMEKDYKYFLNELKELRNEPKSEFRDAMFTELNKECKEKLGVELPAIEDKVVVKDSVIEKSVGFKDTQAELEDGAEKQEKPLVLDAQAEQDFFARMYRKMDDPAYAQKLASMTYYDVIDIMKGKGEL